MWIRAKPEDHSLGSPLIELEGRKGLWVEKNDMWSKYLRRPMDTLSDMCFAQFAKMYTSIKTGATEYKDDSNDELTTHEFVNDIQGKTIIKVSTTHKLFFFFFLI